MTTFLIIDDEPIAHRILEKYCENLPHLKKAGNCYNAFEAINFLSEKSVDLLFLDINMPKLSGFDFLKTISNPPKVIVTTAYKEFAIEGYELNISDYLLKPFSFERFVKAVNKTIDKKWVNNVSFKDSVTTSTENESMFIKGDKKHYQLFFKDILFIEAYGHYCKVHLRDKMILSLEKISTFESLLPKSLFLRVHKSFVVSKKNIEQIQGNRILIEKHQIPIGQTYKIAINNLLEN